MKRNCMWKNMHQNDCPIDVPLKKNTGIVSDVNIGLQNEKQFIQIESIWRIASIKNEHINTKNVRRPITQFFKK